MSVVPSAFAFKFSMPVVRLESIPKKSGKLLGLSDKHQLIWPGEELEEGGNVQVKAAWNAMGVGFEFEVTGKQNPTLYYLNKAAHSDGIQIWIDTRNTQTIHRANRFCHHFIAIPNRGKKSNSFVEQHEVSRAIEDAPVTDSKSLRSNCETLKDGYRLEVWLDANQLNGFDPEISPRLGFFACLFDAEVGNQSFTVGDAFPFSSDPSVWQSIELSDS
jgi:hypothetical protein